MKNSRKDQLGVTHLLLVLVVVIVVAVVGFAGWQVASKHKKTSNSSTPAVSSSTKAVANAAQSSCETKYHDKDLCKFVAAQEAQPFDKASTVVTMTASDTNGTSNIVLSSDGKGNNSLTMTGSSPGALNSVTLDGHTYIQTEAGGAWVDEGASPSSSSTSSSSESSDSSLKSFAADVLGFGYTKVGKEACGPLTCFKYQIVDTATPGTTQYCWFDTKDYLLREYKTHDSNGDLDMKIAYQKVTITKPSPIQSAQSLYGQ